jgi:putative ABC transport system permease protein
MSWLDAVRTRGRLLFDRRTAESRMDKEFRFHIEMETERLMREETLDPVEARRRALIAFGGVEGHKESLRDGRGRAWLGGFTLDLKLSVRMLGKYPGLTIVGTLAMAFAIWMGAVTFEMVRMFAFPALPLPDGDRIVRIRSWDVVASNEEQRLLRDFLVWRTSVRSVTDLGAYRDVNRNLIARDGTARPTLVAEITASAFRIAPETPLLGRVIVEADERGAAPAVVVLGWDVWRTRFGSDSQVVGRTVQLGDAYATVIGVMPEGYEFPLAHELWTPLRPEMLDRAPRAGPDLTVFGRLADGVSREQAQTELTALGKRAAIELPRTHEHLQPQVLDYANMFQGETPPDNTLMLSLNIFAILLLVLICGNVALLLFARAATRETELIVRSALGASRARIVAQLFIEALVLGCVAAAVGLVAAQFGLQRWGPGFLEGNLPVVPFWFDPNLSPATVMYAFLLTLIGAVVAGALPARKITRDIGSRLKQGTAGSGLRFNGVWTVVIVTQVALTVAFPAVVYVEQQELRRLRSYDVGFRASEYLAVGLEMEPPSGSYASEEEAGAAHRTKFASVVNVLRARVAAEPGVAGVTFVDRLPRDHHRERQIELDDSSGVSGVDGTGLAIPDHEKYEAGIAAIDPSYFEVLNVPILAGRAFQPADVTTQPRVVIVDEGFVARMMRGRNPIGQRLRFAAPQQLDGSQPAKQQPWYQIIGVVKDLGMGLSLHRERPAGVYLPLEPGSIIPIQMVVHAKGDPLLLGSRVRALATSADANLRVSTLLRVDQVTDTIQWVQVLWLRISLVLTAIALLLSLAGIYAVLSFTVARRTREIGIRVALGANARRVVIAIFRRPLIQVSMGVLAGSVLAGVAPLILARDALSPVQVALVAVYGVFMMGVCMLACIVPTRRALSVEPTDALRAE